MEEDKAQDSVRRRNAALATLQAVEQVMAEAEAEAEAWVWAVVGVIELDPCLMVYNTEEDARKFLADNPSGRDTILRCFVLQGVDFATFDVVAQKRLMWVQALVQA